MRGWSEWSCLYILCKLVTYKDVKWISHFMHCVSINNHTAVKTVFRVNFIQNAPKGTNKQTCCPVHGSRYLSWRVPASSLFSIHLTSGRVCIKQTCLKSHYSLNVLVIKKKSAQAVNMSIFSLKFCIFTWTSLGIDFLWSLLALYPKI